MKQVSLFLFYLVAFQAYGQDYSLGKSSTSNSSSISTIDGLFLSQTIGQPSLVGSFQSDNFRLVQGFEHLVYNSQAENLKRTLNVFPNPTNGQITIEFDINLSGNFELVIYDSSGNYLLSQGHETSSGPLELDLSSFAKGIYYLRVEGSKHEFKPSKIILK